MIFPRWCSHSGHDGHAALSRLARVRAGARFAQLLCRSFGARDAAAVDSSLPFAGTLVRCRPRDAQDQALPRRRLAAVVSCAAPPAACPLSWRRARKESRSAPCGLPPSLKRFLKVLFASPRKALVEIAISARTACARRQAPRLALAMQYAVRLLALLQT